MNSFIIFFRAIWTPRLLILPLLGGLSTWICWRYGFIYNMNIVLTVFYVGIFFTFGIVMSTVDQRRFEAFDLIAQLKALLFRIAHLLANKKADTQELFTQIKTFVFTRDITEEDNKLKVIEQDFCRLQDDVLQSKLENPQQAAVLAMITSVHDAFEKLLMIKRYRTPRVLRMFLVFSLTSSVFILGPQFAVMDVFGVVCSVIVGFLLQALLEIQDMIENPFSDDMDDIHQDVFGELAERGV